MRFVELFLLDLFEFVLDQLVNEELFFQFLSFPFNRLVFLFLRLFELGHRLFLPQYALLLHVLVVLPLLVFDCGNFELFGNDSVLL